MEITINISEKIVEYAKIIGNSTQRDVETVISDTLEMLLPTLENIEYYQLNFNMTDLPDSEVLKIANSKMNMERNIRLGELQNKGKNIGLTEAEQSELTTLIKIYEIGQLRKSEALAEAVKRGLREPLSS
jgi:stage III sporulation protein SpoIIIAA